MTKVFLDLVLFLLSPTASFVFLSSKNRPWVPPMHTTSNKWITICTKSRNQIQLLMVVESPRVNLFSPILSNREMIDESNDNLYVNDLKFAYELNQMYSGLTYGLPISRKRSRDASSVDPSVSSFVNQNRVSLQIYQQAEIDRLIAHHMEKVRSEIELTRRRNSMRLIAAAAEGIKQKLRSKQEEIVRIGNLNFALEEKIKSMSIENQLWQQMAESNEATANVLRHNLQQIVAQIQQQQEVQNDDVESCCGSNYDERDEQRTLVEDAYCITTAVKDNNGRRLKKLCRNCGKVESCVLLLPCRHLCICTVCESSINVCPICKSSKNASLHVNMN